MESPGKRKFYWFTVFLYGVALTAVLLYLRFPEKSFKKYCETNIEKWLPGVECRIGAVGYGYPAELVFKDLRITLKNNDAAAFEDERFSLQPAWKHITSALQIQSRAFGGNHSARININRTAGNISLNELQIEKAQLGEITLFQRADKKIEGFLSGNGSATIHRQSLAVVSAKGDFTVSDLAFELNNPLFQLITLEVDSGDFQVNLSDNRMRFMEGRMANAKIDGTFQGDVVLADPLWITKLTLTGSIIPKVELFQGNKQLQAVVTGVKRRYNSDDIPFRVGGTIKSPTFIFGK